MIKAGGVWVALLLLGVFQPASGQQEDSAAPVRAAVESYNRAFVQQDLVALKGLLAPDIILYEHSVKNDGLDDVWDNHLKPEVQSFEGTTAEFSDVRVWVQGDVALVTRQYRIKATMKGRAIDAKGNETMGWARRDGRWMVVHIHYSHACPRPS